MPNSWPLNNAYTLDGGLARAISGGVRLNGRLHVSDLAAEVRLW